MRVPLAAFELDCVLGEGGMGRVLAGVHREHGAAVAVKVLTDVRTRDPRFIEGFRSEVRAVAGLRHRAIVRVYDHGVVDQTAEAASEGILSAGSPYLVMEKIDGTSLRSSCGFLPWPDVLHVLREILGALAHAHARGVIHRDLKPENVLVSERGRRITLTDFGLADLLDRDDSQSWDTGLVLGTRGFMAPEQVTGQWRDQGPWTDLYALGCLAFALISGGAPGETFDTRIATPEGLPDWIGRLVAAHPATRYRHAADARLGLDALGEATVPPTARDGVRTSPRLTEIETVPTTIEEEEQSFLTTSALLEPVSPPGAPPPGTDPAPQPPVPEDWRVGGSTSDHLLGVGLGLYGLRSIPVVGREVDRDLLWEALRRVRETGRVEAMVLRGAAGSGKSRLCQWLCERAAELGGATVLRAAHSPSPGPVDGVGAMIKRHLRLSGLSRSETARRIHDEVCRLGWRRSEDWQSLCEIVHPAAGEDDGGPRVRFSSASERHHVVQRYLEHVAAERPVVLWLDDVQWGLDTLDLATHLLESRRLARLPLLIVCTARHDALTDRPAESDALDRLLGQEGAVAREIGPLDPDDRRALVQGLLGLEPSVAARVEERTNGNPLFAVQLVGDWVQRGVLIAGDRGFEVRPGAKLELPDDLHEVWTTRVERVLEGRSESDARALELAAALGQEVDGSEWQEVCRRSGAWASDDLVDTLMEQRLARPNEGGSPGSWSFVHGMLRESVERRADEAGRLASHHRVCAAMLEDRGAAHQNERIGRHLLVAKEFEQAIDRLAQALAVCENLGEFHRALVLLALREEALQEVALPPNDRRWCEGWLLWGICCRSDGRLDEAEDWAQKVLQMARPNGWQDLVVDALQILGSVERYRGNPEPARKHLEEAVRLAEALADRGRLARARRESGWTRLNLGHLAAARGLFNQAISDCEASGDLVDLALTCNGLGVTEIQAGRLDQAKIHLERSRAVHEGLGSRTLAAFNVNSLGDVARMQGELDQAEEHYRFAIRALQASGYGHICYAQMNLALVLLERREYGGARELLLEALAVLVEQGVDGPVGVVHGMLLPTIAAAKEWERFDSHLESARDHLDRSGMVDVDVAWPVERAGELAHAAGEDDRARRAYELSLEQWRAFDREAEVRRVESALAGLGPDAR